ncbi:transmembrane protein [Cystoisospora suis]|uniref:Transmembrane protein n=1 Tax=Cystoisospora suis TaxID=483139 RepID=A0A2C6KVQ4_9APIC|nr:transmembrane protein [Cystoisospora suis]
MTRKRPMLFSFSYQYLSVCLVVFLHFLRRSSLSAYGTETPPYPPKPTDAPDQPKPFSPPLPPSSLSSSLSLLPGPPSVLSSLSEAHRETQHESATKPTDGFAKESYPAVLNDGGVFLGQRTASDLSLPKDDSESSISSFFHDKEQTGEESFFSLEQKNDAGADGGRDMIKKSQHDEDRRTPENTEAVMLDTAPSSLFFQTATPPPIVSLSALSSSPGEERLQTSASSNEDTKHLPVGATLPTLPFFDVASSAPTPRDPTVQAVTSDFFDTDGASMMGRGDNGAAETGPEHTVTIPVHPNSIETSKSDAETPEHSVGTPVIIPTVPEENRKTPDAGLTTAEDNPDTPRAGLPTAGNHSRAPEFQRAVLGSNPDTLQIQITSLENSRKTPQVHLPTPENSSRAPKINLTTPDGKLRDLSSGSRKNDDRKESELSRHGVSSSTSHPHHLSPASSRRSRQSGRREEDKSRGLSISTSRRKAARTGRQSSRDTRSVSNARSTKQACRSVANDIVNEKVDILQSQADAALSEVRKAQAQQRKLFEKLQAQIAQVDLKLRDLEEKQQQLSMRLGGLSEHLQSEEEKQLQVFASDIKAFINTTGIQTTMFKQGELAGKVKALTASSKQNGELLASLERGFEESQEQMKELLATTASDLERFSLERSTKALSFLEEQAGGHFIEMQRYLNDMKLDHLLLAQTVETIDAQLAQRGVAVVDISQLDETASFSSLRMAFENLLFAKFPDRKVLPMFVVTQCPPSLQNVNFLNHHWILSLTNILELFDMFYHTPRASGVVVRIETVMAESWIEVAGRALEAHYLIPSDHDSVRVASKELFAYQFLKSLRSFHVDDIVDPEDRKIVIVLVGSRNGSIRRPEHTAASEFEKLQALRAFALMHASPSRDVSRLWKVMQTEVELLNVFATVPPIHVDGCVLRIATGRVPLPALPPSPFFRDQVAFVRVEVRRSPRRGREYLYPKAPLLERVLAYLVTTSHKQSNEGQGSYAVISAKLNRPSWVKSRFIADSGEFFVRIHQYLRTLAPAQLQSEKNIPLSGNATTMARVVDFIRAAMTNVVMKAVAGTGIVTEKHVFIHICEAGVSCSPHKTSP